MAWVGPTSLPITPQSNLLNHKIMLNKLLCGVRNDN